MSAYYATRGGGHLNHFEADVACRLKIEGGSYVIFGRVAICNFDGDAQNAFVQLTARDGSVILDKVEMHLKGNADWECFSVQGVYTLPDGQDEEIIDLRCGTYRGYRNHVSLIAIQVDDIQEHGV